MFFYLASSCSIQLIFVFYPAYSFLNLKNKLFECEKIIFFEFGRIHSTQAEWMQDVLSEEGKSRTLLCLRLPAPPPTPFWATRHYLHAYLNCPVPMKPTKSKKYMLALIVINQMVKRSQALSSRQRAPPSVNTSASGVRAPPHVGKVE